jgi:hypothetical protein
VFVQQILFSHNIPQQKCIVSYFTLPWLAMAVPHVALLQVIALNSLDKLLLIPVLRTHNNTNY